ncbi:MAG: pectin acetylesterase-family hydrolase [Pseudoxanthomonas sp.]
MAVRKLNTDVCSAALVASAWFFLQCAPATPTMQNMDLGGADLSAPTPLGAPITAAMNTWTWVDFPEAVCDDGTPTGIGVNLNGSKDLLVFLNGGGACWDYQTCAVLNTSSHGPYGRAQFSAVAGGTGGTILDRAAPNPFANYNLVYVPYCTGDIHGGDNVITYTSGTSQKVIHHKGRANVVAYLKRLAATIPAGGKIVVSGSSAGGFGSNMVYDLFHQYFGASKLSMLDDSGPLFLSDAISASLRNSWYASWGLDRTLGPVCPACAQDMSALIPALTTRYPGERMALLSYTKDGVIRAYFGQTEAAFQTNLYALASQRFDTTPQLRYYFVTGTGHTFLAKPGATTAQGIPLWTWITQFANDDPAWTSTKP